MKKLLLIISLIYSAVTFGQEQEVNLIQSTWGREIIKLPFWFAPQINYEGYEDIRFAKGWEKIESSGFWATAFAWNANLETKLTSKFFENNIKLYFDGLMKAVNEDSGIIIPKTKAFFLANKTEKGITTFVGTIETYDAFTTKKVIKLNVIIESYYCKKNKKYVPLFKLSPKDFTHQIWEELKSIKLQENICN